MYNQYNYTYFLIRFLYIIIYVYLYTEFYLVRIYLHGIPLTRYFRNEAFFPKFNWNVKAFIEAHLNVFMLFYIAKLISYYRSSSYHLNSISFEHLLLYHYYNTKPFIIVIILNTMIYKNPLFITLFVIFVSADLLSTWFTCFK